MIRIIPNGQPPPASVYTNVKRLLIRKSETELHMAKTIYFNDDLFVLMLNQKRNYDLETSACDSIINIVL